MCTPCPVSSSNLTAELEELCHEPLCLLGVRLTLSMIVLVFMFLYITIIFIHIVFSCCKPPLPFSWGPHLSTVCLLKFLNQAEVGICLFNRSIGVPKEQSNYISLRKFLFWEIPRQVQVTRV